MLVVTYKDANSVTRTVDGIEISYQGGTAPALGTGSIQVTGLGNMFIPLKDVVSIGWTDTIPTSSSGGSSTTTSS